MLEYWFPGHSTDMEGEAQLYLHCEGCKILVLSSPEMDDVEGCPQAAHQSALSLINP